MSEKARPYASKDKTTKGRMPSRAPRAHQSGRVELSPTGITLRPDGSNFLEWHEALSNHLMSEFTPHGMLLKDNAYIETIGPARTNAQWTALRNENGLDADSLATMKLKLAEKRIAATDKMKQDRYAMYGIVRSSVAHAVLDKMTSVEGYAAIHTAGNQPLEFVVEQKRLSRARNGACVYLRDFLETK